MSATKLTIKSIQTTLYAEELGTCVVLWNMAVDYTPNPDHNQKPWWEPETIETRTVEGIKLIELCLFDKVGVNITAHIVENPQAMAMLKRKLIDSTLDKEVSELQGKEVVS